MKYKKYHRKYPTSKWEYKAISTKVDDKEIIFYTLTAKGKKSKGVEIYQGRNYDPKSTARSYSRRYTLQNLPDKYKSVVDALSKKHKATKWSTKAYVNLN